MSLSPDLAAVPDVEPGLSDPARLAALHHLALLDASPEEEFDRVARLAMRLLEASAAYVNFLDDRRQLSKSAVGVAPGATRELPVEQSICQHVVRTHAPLMVEDLAADPSLRDHPARAKGIEAYVGVPLRSPDGLVLGTLCVVDSTRHSWNGSTLETLADLGAGLETLIRERALAREVAERVRVEAEVREQMQLADLTADVSLRLARGGPLREVLQGCAEIVVRHLDAAFARIWTLNEAEQVLELQASAGMYTHLDGPHGRVPVGQFKIGLIAEERLPHLTNQVVGDPRVGDQEWARREGMVSFAGYPLLVGDRVAGVVAAFARHPLSEAAMEALGAVGNAVAVGIDRVRAEERMRESEARKSAMMEAALDCVLTIDHAGRVQEWNPAAERTFGYSREEALGREMAELIVPPALREAHRNGMRRYLATGEGKVIGRRIEISAVHRDGREIPVELTITRVPGDGPASFTGYLRDITDRKRGERERAALLAREQMTRVEAEAAEQRARFLSEAGRVLAGSLESATLAASLARLTVPFLADWCAVELLQEDGTLLRAATADVFHRDADFGAELHRLTGGPDGAELLAGVVRTGEPVLVRDGHAAARDRGLDATADPGIEAAIVVPLRTGSVTHGVLTVLALEGGRRYGDAELGLAVELAARAAVALENARLHREVSAARAQLEQQNEELIAQGEELAVQAGQLADANAELENQTEELNAQRTHLEELNSELESLNDEMQEQTIEAEVARDRAERLVVQLQHSEARFRELAESIPVQVWTALPTGELDFVTERCAAYFGRTPAEVVGEGWQAVVHPDDLEPAVERWVRSLTWGEPYEVEFRLLCASTGEYRWHLGRAVPLRDSSGAIERWFGTNTDIHGQKLAEQERDQARAEAEEARQAALAASEAKSRFLNIMSHELRTPLGAIGGYVDLLDMGLHGPITEDQQRCLGRIRHNQNHLLGLVNELLDLAKVESGQLVLNLTPVPVAEVVESVHSMIEPQVQAKGLRLQVHLEDPDARVHADRERLEQVVLNLLSNAVKFTPGGGEIAILSDRSNGGVRLHVRDSGIGIPPEKAESIFEAFVQVESPLTRSTGGTGLGLAIARELVRRMGGELSLASEPGVGSTFSVILPPSP